MQLTASFRSLLHRHRPVFTAPTFATFLYVATGWCLSPRHRYVTELIQSSGATHRGHHSRYHRFFSNAAWSLDDLYESLAREAIAAFYPTGEIRSALDDTLCRKRGLTIFGTGMHYDPLISSRSKTLVSWGHDWVVLALLIPEPSWSPSKVWALPVGARLYRNHQGLTKGKAKAKAKGRRPTRRKADPDHRTRPELAVELLRWFARLFPGRRIVVSGDSAYGGQSVLQHLPEGVDLISRVASNAALYEPAPPRRDKQRGAPRKKGARLPAMADWAADPTPPWEALEFDQYGLHATLQVKTIRGLYYRAGKDRLLVIVLVRDVAGGRPDQMFYCTRLEWDARTILSQYAGRWSIEVLFFNSKQMMGFEDPANRTPLAVQRTAPVGMVLYGLMLIWFDREGHRLVSYPDRPWYRSKSEPSFADILSTLRRVSWQEQFPGMDWERGDQKTALAQLVEFVSRAA
jgi:hypothetical protein